ncbi:MAG: diguanylate cyclase [Nitrospirae bacterium YQR-1]
MTDINIHSVLDHLNDGLCLLDSERKIIFWNRAAETISGFSSSEVTGNHNTQSIITHVTSDGVLLANETCLLTKTYNDGAERESEAYIRHKDGRHIYVHSRIFPLWSKDRLGIVGIGEVFTDRRPLHRGTEPVSICTRECCESILQAKLDTLNKTGIAFGLFLVAIDQIEGNTDTLGANSEAGNDEILEMLRQRIVKAIRGNDKIGLWGTYILMVITNNVEDSNIRMIGERLFKVVCVKEVSVNSVSFTPTVSVGATVANIGDTVTTIIKRADRAMNQSLTSGGNRISII